MRINHNITALNTYNKLSANQAATSKSLEKLSSGLKINKAGDNAAGLAISEKMRGQIRGLDQASTNANDAISLINTAEGALSETHSILQRMRELAVQSSNDTNVTVDRGEIQKEMNQLTSEINRIGNTTEFNTQKLLDGGGSKLDPLTTTVTTAGGAAGKVGNVNTVTTSATGKSSATFNAGGFQITLEANAGVDLAGKKISFVDGALGVASGGNPGEIVISASGTSTITAIQAELDAAGLFAGGNVKLTITDANGDSMVGGTTLASGGSIAAMATATTTPISFTAASSASKGVYTFNVDQAFVKDGNSFKLKIGDGASPDSWTEITMTAKQSGANVASGGAAGTFNIGDSAGERFTAEQQAANIATALKSAGTWSVGGGDISALYDITSNGSQVILTEKAAMGPQSAVKNGAFVATNAVAGVAEYTHASTVDVGGSFIIDGEEIAVVDGNGADDIANIAAGTAILKTATDGANVNDQIELLKEAINRNSELNGKYTATNAAAKLTLTQNTGFESSTGPVMQTSNKAGQTFNANFQIGANTAQSMTIEIKDMRAAGLRITGSQSAGTIASKDGTVSATLTSKKEVTDGTSNTGSEYALDVSTHEKATAAITIINDAIEAVSAERSKLGSYSNRLEHTINNLGTSSENMTSAESRIRDVDMAKEMMEFTKNNILSQAAQSMLAQANQQPQGVLQLLQ